MKTLTQAILDAAAAYDRLPLADKVRHMYEQRRSFAIGMAPDDCDFAAYRASVNKRMPPANLLTDIEIAAVLLSIPLDRDPTTGKATK